jgi:hypothetical protein
MLQGYHSRLRRQAFNTMTRSLAWPAVALGIGPAETLHPVPGPFQFGPDSRSIKAQYIKNQEQLVYMDKGKGTLFDINDFPAEGYLGDSLS